jgi:ligand-binding sensor domain-containing protein
MIRTLVLLTFLVSYQFVFSQKYSFVEFSTSEGLPQSQVNAITQDDNGYLWAATFGGLSKFDGKDFTVYGKSDGLLNNRIVHLSFVEDKLYVGHDKGISYSCINDSFCTTMYPNKVSPANVTSILKFQNDIYVGTNGAGLFRFIEPGKELEHIEGSPDRIREVIIHDGKLFLATRNGIFESKDGAVFNNLKESEELSFSSILSKKENLYATTYSGLLLEINEKGIIKTILDKPKNPFRSVVIDDENNFWLNSRNGVILIKQKRVIELTEKNGLPINDVNSVYQDLEGNIWFGTGGKGLVRFTGEVFTYYNQGDLIPSDIIISMIKDSDDNEWFSSFDKGVYKISSEGGLESVDYITSNVWSMDYSKSGIVFGSNFGLHLYRKNQWSSFYEDDGLSSNRIRGVKNLSDTTFLIGTSAGVEIFNAVTHSFHSIVPKEKNLQNVRDFVIQGDSIYLAAQSGLYLKAGNELTNIHQFDASINCIEIDDQFNLWIGTENGLFVERNGKLERKYLEGSEKNDYVNFIHQVKENVFIGTNNGLFEINPNRSKQYHYDIQSGLIDLETNLNACRYDENSNFFWFGTASGLMKMNLSERKTLFDSIPPKLKLTKVKVNFSPVNTPSLYTDNKPSENELRIPYKNNNINFEFDGIFLSNPATLAYQYFLEGFSQEWSPLMNNADINFTNLPPGNYTLSFRAKSGAELYSEIWHTNFEVLPPFYRTWWFYSICVVLVLIVLYMVDRIRVVRLARKNYQLRLEFENKLSKLEQQSLNASMNRHFIFNSLNSIQYYINSSNKESANKYLSRFAKLIRKNLDSSHRKDGMVALGDEIERLQLYLDLESMRFKDKFDYEINIDPHVETEMLKVPAMFLQPFVENSIIHGVLPLKDRKGMIQISVTEHMDHIRIEIEDNGVGIKHSVQKKDKPGDHESQGMLITKGRIELLQKISAKSIEMIGPHEINENDSSINGTIVIFKLIKQYLD